MQQDLFKIFEVFGENGFIVIAVFGIVVIYKLLVKMVEEERKRSNDTTNKVLGMQKDFNVQLLSKLEKIIDDSNKNNEKNQEHNERVVNMLHEIMLLVTKQGR